MIIDHASIQGSPWITAAPELVENVTLAGPNITPSYQNLWYWLLEGHDQRCVHHVFVWNTHYTPGYEPKQAFPWGQLTDVLLHHPAKDVLVIFDSQWEGCDYKNHYAELIDELEIMGLPIRNISMLANGHYQSTNGSTWIDTQGGWAIGLLPLMSHSCDPVTEYHFIMLAKQPRPLRLSMANHILRKQLEVYGHISCGSLDIEMDYRQYCPDLIDACFVDRFPLLLDGKIQHANLQQYHTQDHRFTRAAVNVICETSQDAIFGKQHWHQPWITEKSTKCFLLCQFPLVVGVPGTVSLMRAAGLDLFDDIIDHGYDFETDPSQRIRMVSHQLSILCRDVNAIRLREQHWHRLQANRKLITDKVENLYDRRKIQLRDWLHSR